MTLPLTCIHVTCNIQCSILVCILFIYTCKHYFLLFSCSTIYCLLSLCINLICKITFIHTLISFSLSCFTHNTNYNMTSYHTTITAPSWRYTGIGIYSCLVTRCLFGNSFLSFILKTCSSSQVLSSFLSRMTILSENLLSSKTSS